MRDLRFLPPPIKQQPLRTPQLIPDLTVARRLTGLARKLRQLRGQLFKDIVNPGQVCFCALKL